MGNNKNQKTVDGFGDEWERFDQSQLSEDEHQDLFNRYFSVFTWGKLPENPTGFDMGCGSGRWAKLLAPREGTLYCIDPSSALDVARRNLADERNCNFHTKGVAEEVLPHDSQDCGASLGVIHHVPDTSAGIKACVNMLNPGAPFLRYLYYALDNRPFWFRSIWAASNVFRRIISKLTHKLRYGVSQVIAVCAYWPLARLAYLFESWGASKSFVDTFPLRAYRALSSYTMRTDALDRFGTRLEQRFTKKQIRTMMQDAGLAEISFSEENPHWVAVGYREKV